MGLGRCSALKPLACAFFLPSLTFSLESDSPSLFLPRPPPPFPSYPPASSCLALTPSLFFRADGFIENMLNIYAYLLQALLTEAEQNPPLLSRVLSRLSKSDVVSRASGESLEHDGPDVGDPASNSRPPTAAGGAPLSSSSSPLQHKPLGGSAGGPQSSAGLAKASSDGRTSEAAAAAANSSLGGAAAEEDKEDDAFAQELIDATIMVEGEIATTLDQMVRCPAGFVVASQKNAVGGLGGGGDGGRRGACPLLRRGNGAALVEESI